MLLRQNPEIWDRKEKGLYLHEELLAKRSFSSSPISTSDPEKSKSVLSLGLPLCPHQTTIAYQNPSVSYTL